MHVNHGSAGMVQLFKRLDAKNRELLECIKSASSEHEMELITASQRCSAAMSTCRNEIRNLVELTELEELSLHASSLSKQFAEIMEQMEVVAYFEAALNVECLHPRQEEMVSVQTELDNLVDSLGMLERVRHEMASLKCVDIVRADMQQQLVQPIERCGMSLGLASDPLLTPFVTQTRNELSLLASLFASLSQLATLKPTLGNWAYLRDLLGLRGLKILVKDLLSNPDKAFKAIGELKRQIQGEAQIESMINTVKSHWDAIELEFTKNGLAYKVESVQHQCLEDVSNLAIASKSQYAHRFEVQIMELNRQVNEIFNFLEELKTLQKQWTELGSVFKAENVQEILHLEFESFASSDAQLKGLCKDMKSVSLVRDILKIPNLKVIVERCHMAFKSCSSGLLTFLQSQRELFPSLFNLGDSDLIELLAAHDFRDVNAWVPQLFEGLDHIEFDKESATAIVSKNAEEIVFYEPVSVNQCIVDFLIRIEAQIRHSIKESILPCYESMLSMTFGEFRGSHQVIWMCFQAALQASTQIGYFMDVARSVTHQGLQALLISEIFKFQTSSSNHVHVFVTSNGQLMLDIHGTTFEYCCNYTPLQYTFFRTPITDSFLYSAVHALAKNLGSNPFGPTGTGKTESVKAFGKLLGKQVTVFCCDDSFDCDAFTRIFAGMKISGAWGCFDEFNRLSESVLSSVSKQVYDLMHDPSSQSSTLIEFLF